ncbi:MAG: hypothetical protein CMJ23_01545 [Phycisphaerae bacterium]|nr:hypothetical protein [Phycisphaerae bacterium]
MAIYGAFDISGSGLQAQRVRMDAISANLANRNTPGFQVKTVEFAPGDPATGNPLGVHVSAIEADLNAAFIETATTFGSSADLADGKKDGLAQMPDYSDVRAMADGIEALRAYQANIQAIDTTRSMIDSAIRVLA